MQTCAHYTQEKGKIETIIEWDKRKGEPGREERGGSKTRVAPIIIVIVVIGVSFRSIGLPELVRECFGGVYWLGNLFLCPPFNFVQAHLVGRTLLYQWQPCFPPRSDSKVTGSKLKESRKTKREHNR